MATKPRQILPGRSWFVTSKAILRQHRFVPEAKVVETLWYCLGVASEKYKVQLHGFAWMSNHYHLVLTDPAAHLPDFMRDLNSLISKALNAIRGIRGENFARKGYNAVVVADAERLLRHCAYTEANPCNAHLVDRAIDWEGVTSAGMAFGEKRSFLRPTYGLWKQAGLGEESNKDPHRASKCGKIKCPEVVTLQLVPPPPRYGQSSEHARESIRNQVASLEQEARQQRVAKGTTVMGMDRVRRVRYKSAPSSREDFFGTVPEVSGDDPEVRKAVEREYKAFVQTYRFILTEYKNKRPAVFPRGTWWMKRHLNAECLHCPSG